MKYKYCLLTLFVTGVLMAGFFFLGRCSKRNTVIVSPFSVLRNDSVGVYEVSNPEVFTSKENDLQVYIWMISLGEKDWFYTLKLSNEESLYHGDFNEHSHLGMGYFMNSSSEAPLQFFDASKPEDCYIIVNKKKILLTRISE